MRVREAFGWAARTGRGGGRAGARPSAPRPGAHGPGAGPAPGPAPGRGAPSRAKTGAPPAQIGGSRLRALLAVDGDSFAHRAYHALPKTMTRAGGRPAGAIVGFTNMLLRLWEAEAPAAVLVGWDTLEAPTYRHEAFPAYQSGRQFDEALLEQLELLPDAVRACGFAAAKAAGYEADDFLAATAGAWPDEVFVATSDRDAFQLVSERVTVLQPKRGVSELVRIGPAEVRERTGVEPAQVPDLIALRGDPSDRLPGARGVGAKRVADLLARYGSLEAVLADGRFAAEAEELRLYRRIAAMDASAPLPPLEGQTPTWAEASSYFERLGLGNLARRLAALAG